MIEKDTVVISTTEYLTLKKKEEIFDTKSSYKVGHYGNDYFIIDESELSIAFDAKKKEMQSTINQLTNDKKELVELLNEYNRSIKIKHKWYEFWK